MIVYQVGNDQDAYSVRTFAERHEVSEDTVYRMIKAGQIQAFHFGRQLRIPATEVDRVRAQGAAPHQAGRHQGAA